MDIKTQVVHGIKSFNTKTTFDLSYYPRLNPYVVGGMLITTCILAFMFPLFIFISLALLFIIIA